MISHPIPFENRWASGQNARRWYLELEREGVETIQLLFVDHEAGRGDEREVFGVPVGFVRDWLAYHHKSERQRQRFWRVAVLVFTATAAAGSVVAAVEAAALLLWR